MSQRSISNDGGGVYGQPPNKKALPQIIDDIDEGGQDTLMHNVIGTPIKTNSMCKFVDGRPSCKLK